MIHGSLASGRTVKNMAIGTSENVLWLTKESPFAFLLAAFLRLCEGGSEESELGATDRRSMSGAQ